MKERRWRIADAMVTMPGELFAQIEALARTQNRTSGELVCEAAERYIDDQKWRMIVDRGSRRGKAKGFTEEDVPRLVDEVRAENRTRMR